jgi:hypothetical protein
MKVKVNFKKEITDPSGMLTESGTTWTVGTHEMEKEQADKFVQLLGEDICELDTGTSTPEVKKTNSPATGV